MLSTLGGFPFCWKTHSVFIFFFKALPLGVLSDGSERWPAECVIAFWLCLFIHACWLSQPLLWLCILVHVLVAVPV